MGPKLPVAFGLSRPALHNQNVIFHVLVTPPLTFGLDCGARKLNRSNSFVAGCVQGSYVDCTAIGDEVVILIMIMLSVVMMCISLSFYTWPMLFVVC